MTVHFVFFFPCRHLKTWSEHNFSWPGLRDFNKQVHRPLWNRQVDALLSGHGEACDWQVCTTNFNVSASNWSKCAACVTNLTLAPSVLALRTLASQEFSEVAASVNPDCEDDKAPDEDKAWTTTHRAWQLLQQAKFVDMVYKDKSMTKDTSCVGGCPEFARPFCKAGDCGSLRCADASACMQPACFSYNPLWNLL